MKKHALIGYLLALCSLSAYAQGNKPDPPSNISVSVTTTSATIRWSAVTGATGYDVEVSLNQNYNPNLGGTASSTSFTVANLLSGTLYYYRVRTLATSGNQTRQSDWVTGTFPTQQAPPPPPSAPSLTAPSNGATGVPINTTLSWNNVAGATSYDVQLSGNSDLSSPILNASPTGASASVSGLSGGTTYYWQVRSKNLAGTSAWSAASFTTVALPPNAPSIIAPTNGATGISTSPTLSWSSVSGATSYDVQLSPNSNFSPLILNTSATGTSTSVSSLTNGMTYYWQVRAKNSAGATSAWSTASFTTQSAKPSPPPLVSPANGATGVSTSAVLVWNKVANATSYNIELSTSDKFTGNSVIKGSGADTTFGASGLDAGRVYYWRVSATGAGGTSDWSGMSSFTTQSTQLSPPALVSPTNGAKEIPASMTLTWNKVANATSYVVEVYTKQGYNGTPYARGTVMETSFGLSGLSLNITYYWQVSATNASGSSGWSQASFTTETGKPFAPALVSPSNGESGVSISPTLTWNKVKNATSYYVELSKSDKFTGNSVIRGGGADTTFNVSGLDAGQIYYWHVGATGVGGTGEWSSTINFKTLSAKPQTPVLTTPADQDTGVAVSPLLVWKSVANATQYTVQLAKDPGFKNNDIVAQASGRDTASQATNLENGKTYYWRVNASNEAGAGDWASASYRTVSKPAGGGQKPLPPTPVSPASGAADVSITPTLTWNRAKDATLYSVELATTDKLSGNSVIRGTTNDTSFTASGLDPGQMYYWRVNATNNNGTSEWSTTPSFKTVSIKLAAPVLVAPLDGATSESVRPTLMWSKVKDATSYAVEVSTKRNYPANSTIRGTSTDTSFAVSGLEFDQTYYWHVSASGPSGISTWSGDGSFKTETGKPTPPKLISPGDGALGIPTSPQFVWAKVQGATSYILEVSTNKTFPGQTSPMYSGPDTSFAASGLDVGKQYYWRVLAVNAARSSDASTPFGFTTSAARLAPPTPLSPASNAKDVPTTPTLKWTASPGATSYTLQYTTDKGKTFSSAVEVNGITQTFFTLIGLTAKESYRWRVRAADTVNVSEWSQDWTFATGANQLAAPSLMVPLDRSKGLPLNLVLEWRSVPGAKTYGAQVSTDRKFETIVVDVKGLDTTSLLIKGLLPSSTYYWRANASDTTSTSEWSKEEWFFTTGTSLLGRPILLSPQSKANGVSINPLLQWSALIGAKSYGVQIWSSDKNRQIMVLDTSGVLTSSLQLMGLQNKETYYWKVNAADGNVKSDWSEEWNFTTGSGRLSAPKHVAPPDKAAGVSIKPKVKWEESLGAQSYNLHVASDKNFQKTVVNLSGIKNTSLELNVLEPKVTYYWRTSAVDSTGPSDWSLETSFTTGSSILSAPFLASPAHNTSGISISPTLTWDPSEEVSAYALQYATDKNFSKNVVDVSGITSTSYSPSSLAPQQTYYWRVQAKDTSNASDWSESWMFTTGTSRLPAPVLVSPRDKESFLGRPVLEWSASNGAKSYTVHIATNQNFHTMVVDQGGIVGTSFVFQDDGSKKNFFWRVQAFSALDTSDWSATWSFTISTATSTERITESVPGEFQLQQNYPNPFNPSTTIPFSVPYISFVRITVYNVLGSEVEVLVEDEMTAGNYHARWNAAAYSSGTYFYRIHAVPKNGSQGSEFVQTKKLMLVK